MAAGQGFKTFVTGDVLTAGDTNGYLMQGVWVFASAAARSAAVTSPQEGNFSFLKDTNSTEYYDGAAWVAISSGASSFIGAKAYPSAAISIANNTGTALLLNTEQFDTSAIHSTATNTSRFTIPATMAGYWRITAAIWWASAANGFRSVYFAKNGTAQTYSNPNGGDSNGNASFLSETISCSVGDYLEAYVLQTSGGALNVQAGVTGTGVEVQFLGA